MKEFSHYLKSNASILTCFYQRIYIISGKKPAKGIGLQTKLETGSHIEKAAEVIQVKDNGLETRVLAR